jgi:hypothetical protein
VPKFKYDQATRLDAAKMLGPNAGSYKTWADEAKSDINAALKKEVDAALGVDHYKDFKPSLVPSVAGMVSGAAGNPGFAAGVAEGIILRFLP